MKKIIILTLLLTVFQSSLFSQKYDFYYNTCNKADKLVYERQYNSALELFEKAFDSVDYIHSTKLWHVCKCAILAGDNKKGYEFAKQSIINCGKDYVLKQLKPRKYKTFRKTTYFKNLKDSLDYFISLNKEIINKEYVKQIDSLLYFDQNVIRNNKSVKGNYNVNLEELPENKWEIDEMNLKCLLSLIVKYGFPSEEKVGLDSYYKATMIILHNIRKKEHEKYHPLLIDAINKGWYLPEDFEFLFEQFSMQYNNSTFFTTWDKNLSQANLDRLNSNRKKFYLKNLSSKKISGGGRRTRNIW